MLPLIAPMSLSALIGVYGLIGASAAQVSSSQPQIDTVVCHKFATPEKVQTHLISYTLKDKLKHRCREYLERGFKRHSERSVKNIKSRHILRACFLGPWFQTFELPLYLARLPA
jgi:hypothetical protein